LLLDPFLDDSFDAGLKQLLFLTLGDEDVGRGLFFSLLLELVKVRVWIQSCLVYHALGYQFDREVGSHSKLATHGHRPAHVLNNFLADGQAKPSTALVAVLSIVELAKIDEELFDAFFRYPTAGVLDSDLQGYIVLLPLLFILVSRR